MAFEKIPLSELVATNIGQLAPLELAIGDGLTEHLSESQNIDSVDLAVVVDADQEDPVAKFDNGDVYIRYNGRFSIPKFDKNGVKVPLDSAGWRNLTKEWFQENDMQYAFDDTSEDVMKFTAIAPSFTVPVSAPEEETEEEKPEESGEETEESEEKTEETEQSPEDFEKELNK
jgi:hypothetical protein